MEALVSVEECYLDLVSRGIDLYWTTLATARNMKVHTGDIDYVTSTQMGCPAQIFNMRLHPDTAEQRIREVVRDMEAGVLPRSILVSPRSRPDNLVSLLETHGFSIDAAGMCMAIDLEDWPLPDPSGTRVVLAQNHDMLADWMNIVNYAFTGHQVMDFWQFADLFDLNSTDFFIGVAHNRPVATGMTIEHCGVATLEFVTTLPYYRNQGLGTAVTVAALLQLRERGVKTVTLRATPGAISLYKRIGFKEICPRIVASL